MEWIRIETRDGVTAFLPGETIEGTVGWHFDTPGIPSAGDAYVRVWHMTNAEAQPSTQDGTVTPPVPGSPVWLTKAPPVSQRSVSRSRFIFLTVFFMVFSPVGCLCGL
jgi:hypothetical protein